MYITVELWTIIYIFICYMQIHHKLIGVMRSNDRLLRTVYKISVDKGFLTF